MAHHPYLKSHLLSNYSMPFVTSTHDMGPSSALPFWKIPILSELPMQT